MFKRLILIAAILALTLTNVLTLTHTAFNTSLSGLMGTYLGVKTVTSAMQAKLASKNVALMKHKAVAINRQNAVRRFGTRLTSRTKRVVSKSIAAIPLESIPLLGITSLIADTGYEIYAACETLGDLDDLYTSLAIPGGVPNDAMHAACSPGLPDPGKVWDDVVTKSGEWLDRVKAAI